MILSDTVEVVVSQQHRKYYRDRGYSIPNSKNPKIVVRVSDLSKSSHQIIMFRCDDCGVEKLNRYGRAKSQLERFEETLCHHCVLKLSGFQHGHRYGYMRKGVPNLKMRGTNHPRWNPDKTAYQKYARRVYANIKLLDFSKLPNGDKPRRLCGVDGGYQLDHLVSVRYGFFNKISPDIISHPCNLQIIPWKENRKKWHHCDTDIETLIGQIEAYQWVEMASSTK